MNLGSGPLIKGVMVVLVALLVLVPVQLLQGLVQERAQLRQQAVDKVARGWGGTQVLGGPVLAIPASVTREDGRVHLVDWYVLPETLTLESELVVQDERRKLGVYEVPVYVTTVRAVATFDIASKVASQMQSPRASTLHLERARLVVPVSDTRGVRDVRVTGTSVASGVFEPDRSFDRGALATPLRPDAQLDKGEQRFEMTMQVAGTYSLSFIPLARSTTAQLAGNWADPGFTRGFLPVDRGITADRFNARWQVLDLNRGFPSHWFSDQVAGAALSESAFGVELVQPVDLYQRAERSVKYAGLFIALSLLTLFVWEHLARRPVHPIQYGLMGLAMSVFYLLLLALAEHIGFTMAYVSAAAALCALMGFYLAGASDSSRAGSGAASVFAGVYALLFLLVTSEDYSLLAGSLAVFALLATAMVLTRRLDWYQATARSN